MENNYIEQMIENVIKVNCNIFELYVYLRNCIYFLEEKLGGYDLLK